MVSSKSATKAQLKASAKYDKAHTKSIILKFNKGTDTDILQHLETLENKQGYIKKLIRADILKTSIESSPDKSDEQYAIKCRFSAWLKNCQNIYYSDEEHGKLIEFLKNIGISINSLFDLNDAQVCRLYASELIVKRVFAKCDSDEYLKLVGMLLAYSEFIELPNKEEEPKTFEIKAADVNSEDVITICYFLSRCNMEAVRFLGYRTFTEAFNELSVILNQKASTVKNIRDEFDPYFDNGRVGWYQRQLSPSRKNIFDKYNDTTDKQLRIIVQRILNNVPSKAFNGENQDEDSMNNNHKKIVIKSNSMKEIRKKK